MRKIERKPVKTVDFAEIDKYGKYLISIKKSPAEALDMVHERYLKPAGIKYHLEGIKKIEFVQQQTDINRTSSDIDQPSSDINRTSSDIDQPIPAIIYQTDKPEETHKVDDKIKQKAAEILTKGIAETDNERMVLQTESDNERRVVGNLGSLQRRVVGNLGSLQRRVESNPASEFQRRLILVCDRATRDHKIQAASEANGIVVDYNTWQVLSYPPAALSFNMQHEDITMCLRAGLYKIYRADFGTVVTLYYYAGKWRLSTANAYEIDNMIWIGTRTFRELVDEVFAKYGVIVDNLDTKYCYSFGFHHNEYHPFNGAGQDPIRAWFIRAVNLTEFNVSTEANYIGSYKFDFVSNNIIGNKIPMQQEAADLNILAAADPVAAVKKMHDLCDMAYTKYVTDNRTTPIYGFILISNNPEENANALIESKLQCKLRQFVCRRPPADLPVEKRFNWMMVNASIDSIDSRPVFRKLFPQTKAVGDQFDQLIGSLARRIVGAYNKDDIVYTDTGFDEIVKFAINYMKEHRTDINRNTISIKIVEQFLCQPNFCYLYATLL